MLVFLVLGLLSDMVNKSLVEIDKRLKGLEKKDLYQAATPNVANAPLGRRER